MITVFLRKINGKGEKLQVNPKITTSFLLKEISKSLSCESLPQSQQGGLECYYRGTKLEEHSEESIEDVGITANSIIHIVQRIQFNDEKSEINEIHVKMIIKNKLFEYEIGQDYHIQDLKQTICQDLEIKEEDLTLSYLGVELEDGKTVREYQFSQGVLLSASVAVEIPSAKFAQTYSVSRESYSEQSEGIPKIVRKESSPLRKKMKKAESLNMPAFDLKSKNINFCSVRLNKIQEKNDESKIQSQINESEEKSEEEISEVEEEMNPVEWQKPKMTLDLLSKPWYGDQKIIETQSIVGDEDSEETSFTECFLELTRIDKKRQYVLQCGLQHTFEDALKTLARLERLQPSAIKFLISFDEVSKSGISSQSSKGIQKSSRSSESIKRQRSSHEGCHLSVHRHQGMKTKIFEKASKSKSKIISIEYQIYRSI